VTGVQTCALPISLNVILARPNLLAVAGGLVPSLPEGGLAELWPRIVDGRVLSPAGVLVSLVATTMSVAGAFYQGYLVKEKGWQLDELPQQKVDSAAGIFVLTGISMIVMLTSAAVLHDAENPVKLASVSDVAKQLEPLMGSWGKTSEVLFCIGIFAGAFSSFLGNSLIGGVLLSDGLGYDASMQGRATKVCTALGLVLGMIVAIVVTQDSGNRVPVIILGQGLTVLGLPIVAIALLVLCSRVRDQGKTVPKWMESCGWLVLAIVVVLASRTAWQLGLQMSLALIGESS